MPFAWTPAVLDDLHRLFVRDKLSAAETAEALGGGLTRDAVLGKVQRLGWTRPRPAKAARPAAPCSKPGRRAPPPRPVPFGRVLPLPALREITVASTPKPWTERAFGECAFPVGEPAAPGEQYACCAKTPGRSAYCAAHQGLMRMEGTALTPEEVEGIVLMARKAG